MREHGIKDADAHDRNNECLELHFGNLLLFPLVRDGSSHRGADDNGRDDSVSREKMDGYQTQRSAEKADDGGFRERDKRVSALFHRISFIRGLQDH